MAAKIPYCVINVTSEFEKQALPEYIREGWSFANHSLPLEKGNPNITPPVFARVIYRRVFTSKKNGTIDLYRIPNYNYYLFSQVNNL